MVKDYYGYSFARYRQLSDDDVRRAAFWFGRKFRLLTPMEVYRLVSFDSHCPDRGSFSVKTQRIVLNTIAADRGTLMHELVHLWQALRGSLTYERIATTVEISAEARMAGWKLNPAYIDSIANAPEGRLMFNGEPVEALPYELRPAEIEASTLAPEWVAECFGQHLTRPEPVVNYGYEQYEFRMPAVDDLYGVSPEPRNAPATYREAAEAGVETGCLTSYPDGVGPC